MSYTIQYHKEPKKEGLGVRNWIHIPITIILVILSAINCYYMFCGHDVSYQHQLMPWTQPYVQAACSEFIHDAKVGKPFFSCVEDLCREILNGEPSS